MSKKLIVKNEDIKKYTPLVKEIAFKLLNKLPSFIALDDLIQDGYVGLLDALYKYNPDLGSSFETYAKIRIHGAMLDGLRRLDTQPRKISRIKRKINIISQEIEAKTKRKAKAKEIAKELGVSLSEFFKILIDCEMGTVLEYKSTPSVEGYYLEAASGNVELEHFMLIENQLEREELLAILNIAKSKLPKNEQLVFGLYYDKGLSLKDIRKILSVSESRVSQLLSQGNSRIKTSLKHKYGTAA